MPRQKGKPVLQHRVLMCVCVCDIECFRVYPSNSQARLPVNLQQVSEVAWRDCMCDNTCVSAQLNKAKQQPRPASLTGVKLSVPRKRDNQKYLKDIKQLQESTELLIPESVRLSMPGSLPFITCLNE